MTVPRSRGKPSPSPRRALGLRPRLVALTWALTLAFIVVAGGVAYYLLLQRDHASWQERLVDTAQAASAAVGVSLNHVREELAALEPPEEAGSAAVQADLVLDRHPAYLEIASLDSQAQWIAGASRDASILANATSSLGWFKEAGEGRSFVGLVADGTSAGPSILLATPSRRGGVLAARLQVSLLEDALAGIGIARGRVIIVDPAGTIVVSSEPTNLPSGSTVLASPPMAALARSATESFEEDCPDTGTKQALCAASPIAGTDWTVITQVLWTEAFGGTVRFLVGLVAALLGAGLLVSLIIGWRLNVMLFTPLKKVQRAAEGFGRGDLEQEAVGVRRDEIGRVAETLNDMASRLRAQQAAIESHSTQLESLNRVSLSLTKRLDLDSVLETVLGAAFDLFPGLMDALVFLYADDKLTMAAARRGQTIAGKLAPVPRQDGSTYKVARTGEPILIPDVHSDARYPGDPRQWPGALACVPLKVGLRVVGVLNVAYEHAHAFGKEETKLLQLLADQVAIAIENARLYGQAQQELLERRRAEQALQKANEELERKVASRTHALLEANQRLETLKEIDRAILAAQSMTDIAMAGLSRLRGLVRGEHADLVLFDFDRGEGRLLAMEGQTTFGFEVGTTFRLEDYGPVDDLTRGEVRRVDDLKSLPSLTPLRQRLVDSGIRSFLTVPLVADGTLIGELNLDSSRRSAFDIDAELLAREVANQLAVALRQAGLRAALETEQERLGQLVEHLPQAVALLDGEKRVVLANALAREILPELGRWPSTATLQQVAGRPIERLLLSAGHPGWHELRLEAGPRKVFEAAALQLGEGTESAGWIVQIRDVTSERSAQMQQRSQERLAAVGQLAAGIAHDFNNIISVVILYAELLLQAQDRTPQEAERLQTITRQGQRAAQLIQQILDFSRQSVMDQHPFDLVPFLREMEGLLMRTLPETVRVRVVADGPSFMIQGDPARIRQVCFNLALNAREAMPEGGDLRFSLAPFVLKEGDPPPSVDMAPGEWVRLSVSDTGSGIETDVLPHIFEPFFTTRSPAKASGLGLAQVYGIIQQHQGHISVTSSKGRGATFDLYLPVLAAPPTSGPAPETLKADRGQGETILVVEDNEATRASVSEILTSLGYRVLQAAEGKEAMEVFAREEGKIDLILSDLVMPGMGGSELVRQLTAKAPSQRFLLMTGYPLGSTRELLESGTVHWMQKPLSGAKLARAVREALGTGPLP